jgi:4a-hydroxytetrahydrobiopterin dehydratase
VRADFAQAMGFVNEVAAAAEAAGHHPDIDIRWNKVTLALSSHAEGGLTDREFQLAAWISQTQLDGRTRGRQNCDVG